MCVYIYIYIYIHIRADCAPRGRGLQRESSLSVGIQNSQRAIRSKQRDPDPKDNSLTRKVTSTYKEFHYINQQHCFLIQEFLLGSGSLFFATAGHP